MKKIVFIFVSFLFVSCVNNYEEGVEQFDSNNYEEAKRYFSKVNEDSENHQESQLMMLVIDSIISAEKRKNEINDSVKQIEKRKQDSIESANRKARELEELITDLNKEINSAGNYSYESSKDMTSLQNKILFYGKWWDLVNKSKDHEEKKVQKLSKTLKSKVISAQKNAFPKIRKDFGEIAKKLLWQENIEVATLGARNTTLQFTGGIFADNKNKQDVQNMLHENLLLFRFKRTQYKWYEYDDEYTYYTLTPNNDGDKI